MGIPVSVKLSPFHSSTGHFALQLVQAGADGLALFNRFYEPDIDLATLRPQPDFDLSTPADMRLGLTWMSLLHGHLGHTSLAATSGVWSGDDVVKYLLTGADVVMSTSALLRHGPQHVGVLVDGLRRVLSFTSERLVLQVGKRRVTLVGADLCLLDYSPLGVQVTGTLLAVEFGDL